MIFQKAVSLIMILSLFLQSASLILAAELTPDGGTNTTIDQAQNGTPIVNIAPVSAAGVSRNTFTDYNVDQRNLILNNSGILGNSQLGGVILGNAHLTPGQEARIILNEVTSSRPTMLAGTTEIFGRRADLIIANPNGIQVAGAAFINTDRLSLIAGSSAMNSRGGIDRFNLSQGGSVTFTNNSHGLALDTTNLTFSDIVARTISISGEIHAQNLALKTGNDTYNYETKTVTSKEASKKPLIAIDSSALGGMYAHAISIVGTEEGLGVKMDGTLATDVNDIVISNTGDISLKAVNSASNLKVTGDSITTTQGHLEAKNNLEVTARNRLDSDGSTMVTKTGDINLKADSVTQTSGGVINSGGNLSVESTSLLNDNSTIYSVKNATITTQDFQQKASKIGAASIFAGGNMTMNATKIANRQGTLFALNDMNLSSESIVNEGGRFETYSGSLAIQTKTLENKSISLCNPSVQSCYTTQNIVLRSGAYGGVGLYQTEVIIEQILHSNFENQSSLIIAGKDLKIQATDILNESSLFSAGNNLTIHTKTLTSQSDQITGTAKRLWGQHQKINCGLGCTEEILVTWWAPYSVPVSSNTPAAIAANGTVSIVADNFFQNGNKVSADQVISQTRATEIMKQATDRGYVTLPLPAVTDPSSPSGSSSPLFQKAPASSLFLYETDPRLTSVDAFIGSAYFFERLGVDLNTFNTKIIGDAFYEQQLLRDQIVAVTGKPYLHETMQSMDQQMEKLYAKSIDESARLGLTLGIPLTQAQVDSLTEDIIWYITDTVRGVEVLVPQLYLAPQTRQYLAGNSGSLVSGTGVTIQAGQIENSFGTVEGTTISLNSDRNIVNTSGILFATDTLVLTAGGDIISQTHRGDFGSGVSLLQGENMIGTSGKLTVNAGNDFILNAGSIYAADATLTAGHDVRLDTIKTRMTTAEAIYDTYTQRSTESSTGSNVLVKGNLTMSAGNDVLIKGSTAQVGKDLTIDAGNNLNIIADHTHSTQMTSTFKSSGTKFIDYKESSSAKVDTFDDVIGSFLSSGGNTTLQSGNNMSVIGSKIVGQEDVVLSAKGDLTVSADVATHTSRSSTTKKGNGFSASAKDVSAGYTFSKDSTNQFSSDEASVGSSIVGKNVSLASDSNLTVKGSYLGAQEDLNLTGENVTITDILTTNSSQYSHKNQTFSASMRIGNYFQDAVNQTKSASQAVSKTNQTIKQSQDNRSGYINSTMNAVNSMSQITGAVSAWSSAIASAPTSGGFYLGGSMSYATSSETQNSFQTTSNGSSLQAGGALTITAANDIAQKGSNASAKDIAYTAGNDVTIEAGKSTLHQDSSSTSSSAGIQIQAALGPVSGSVNASHEKGSSVTDSVTYSNSHVTAENSLTITAGRDLTIKGGNLQGSDVALDVGGDLNLETLVDRFDSVNKSSGYNGGLGNTGSVTMGMKKGAGSEHAATIQEITSIVGGKSVRIGVGNNTDIKGGVIAQVNEDGSDGGNLVLTTKSLSYSDVATYRESQQKGFGFSTTFQTGMGTDFGNTKEWLGLPLNKNDQAANKNAQTEVAHQQESISFKKGSSTVTLKDKESHFNQVNYATVGQGNITVSGGTNSGGLAGLNRDITHLSDVTRNETTSDIDASMQLDHRALSSEGRSQLIKDFKHIENTGELAGKVAWDASALSDSKLETLNSLDAFYKGLLTQNTLSASAKLSDDLGKLEGDLEAQKTLIREFANSLDEMNGLGFLFGSMNLGEILNGYLDPKYRGFYDETTGTLGIGILGNETANKLRETIMHELIHAMGGSEGVASFIGQNFNKTLNDALSRHRLDPASNHAIDWLNPNNIAYIAENTYKASLIPDSNKDPLLLALINAGVTTYYIYESVKTAVELYAITSEKNALAKELANCTGTVCESNRLQQSLSKDSLAKQIEDLGQKESVLNKQLFEDAAFAVLATAGGTGMLIKAATKAAAEANAATLAAEKAAFSSSPSGLILKENPNILKNMGITTKVDSTFKGADVPNIDVPNSAMEIEQSLLKNGFTKTTISTAKGPVELFTKGEETYSIRDFSNSGPATVEALKNGDTILKIRLKP